MPKAPADADAEFRKALAGRLREARMAAGLTQEQVARLAGTTRHYISNLEHGRTLPSVPMLARIAEAVGASLDRLVGLAERRAKAPAKAGQAVNQQALEQLRKEVLKELERFRQDVMRDVKRFLGDA